MSNSEDEIEKKAKGLYALGGFSTFEAKLEEMKKNKLLAINYALKCYEAIVAKNPTYNGFEPLTRVKEFLQTPTPEGRKKLGEFSYSFETQMIRVHNLLDAGDKLIYCVMSLHDDTFPEKVIPELTWLDSYAEVCDSKEYEMLFYRACATTFFSTSAQ